ncbi:hypothetical protein, partial [Legionella sainthelensi]|uniref:hypothetical protein n=1 Tax=Legionella sainthelensi TaxID=28087 RepID=UPI00135B8F78
VQSNENIYKEIENKINNSNYEKYILLAKSMLKNENSSPMVLLQYVNESMANFLKKHPQKSVIFYALLLENVFTYLQNKKI